VITGISKGTAGYSYSINESGEKTSTTHCQRQVLVDEQESDIVLTAAHPAQKGFTVLELMIVMVVGAILISVALPSFTRSSAIIPSALLRSSFRTPSVRPKGKLSGATVKSTSCLPTEARARPRSIAWSQRQMG
jgi:prepilin-type N-terminal cleavage/methylation domain-containing protein